MFVLDTGLVVNEVTGSPFVFSNLDSGMYSLTIMGSAGSYCWKEMEQENVHLKNENVKNLVFQQTGYFLRIRSSHKTQVEIKVNKIALGFLNILKIAVITFYLSSTGR